MAFEDYVRDYRVVEVQQTFYEPPREATMRRWRAQAPGDFEFTLKAWQLVTHDASSPTYRRLRTPLAEPDRQQVGGFRTSPVVLAAWRRSLDCALLLRATAILLQCPASFGPSGENIEQMRAFFATAERPEDLRFLWEPRGSWPPEVVATLCAELDLVHVVDPFVATTNTPDHPYLRLHGTTGARHVYSNEELELLAETLPSSPAAPAYVMFNNLPRVDDARRFAEVVRRRSGVVVTSPRPRM